MSTAFSNGSKILLAVFASLCILGAAAAIALGTKPAGNNRDTDMTSSAGNMHRDLRETDSKGVSETDVPSTAGEDNNLAMETSAIKLPINKNLRKQTNQLARSRARTARAADEASDGNTAQNNNVQRRDLISCISEKANNTIPAAHIAGYGHRPFAHSTPESSLIRKGYQQRWKCCEFSTTPSHNAAAFVDGGIIFNQTDKSLQVPTCGYYHVSSQIYFRIDPESLSDETFSVSHLLKFRRNCPSWHEYNDVTIKAMSSVSNDDTTTHTSDVVRLCAGGKIWVEIPDFTDGVPCCPMGDDQGTFIAAYLVAETTCHWPPNTMMTNLNE